MNPPRGMRDFLPADKARRERVLAVIRERYRAHGFDEIETPVMEEYARLHAGIGGDNEKLAFNVLKRGLNAEAIVAAAEDPAALTDLGLRYDLTVRASTRPTAASSPRSSGRCRSRPCGEPNDRRRGAIGSSCSATSTSSGMRPPVPRWS